MNTNKKKVILCLGAGGARGLVHIGFLKELIKHNVEVKAIYGSSMGAIIGASFASGFPLSDLEEIFSKTNFFSFLELSLIQKGIFSSKKFSAFLQNIILCNRFEDLNIDLTVSCTNIQTGQLKRFCTGNLLLPVLASSLAAGIFCPTEINKNFYIDGGYCDPIPIPEHIEDNINIIAIDPSVNPSWHLNLENAEYSILNLKIVYLQILKSIDILMHNYIGVKYNKENLLWVKPELPLEMSFSDFSKSEIAIQKGTESAISIIDKLV